MDNDIIKNQIEAYQANFLKYGASPNGTFQNNRETQRERFKQLLLPLLEQRSKGFSICDIGSGLCDLHQYLNEMKVEHVYTGIEIVPEMVAVSQEKNPAARVLNLDFLDESFEEKFDFIVLSGTFNIPGATSYQEWEQFFYSMISRMFERAKIAISFNALTTYTTFRSNELFYVNPEKVLTFIQTRMSRFCRINSAYPLYEFTYTVFRNEAMNHAFSQGEYDKYFSR